MPGGEVCAPPLTPSSTPLTPPLSPSLGPTCPGNSGSLEPHYAQPCVTRLSLNTISGKYSQMAGAHPCSECQLHTC